MTPEVPQALIFTASKVKAFLPSCRPGVGLNLTTEYITTVRARMGFRAWSSCLRLQEEAEEVERHGAMGTWRLEAMGRNLLAGGGARVG